MTISMCAPRDPWWGRLVDKMDADERQGLKDALNPFSSRERAPMIATRPVRIPTQPLVGGLLQGGVLPEFRLPAHDDGRGKMETHHRDCTVTFE